MTTAYVDRRREWIRSRRHKRKHARRARLNRQLFRYILLLAILWVGCSTFQRLPWQVQDWNRDVIVKGNHVASSQQIRSALKEVKGQPIFQIDPVRLEQKVGSLAAVKYAFVRRVAFPKPELLVEVMEEFPWATFATDPDSPASYVIAQSGRFIPLKQFPNEYQPDLKIYGPANLRLTHQQVSQWANWIASISAQTGHPVESVDLRKPFDVRVVDGDLSLKVGTPDTSLTHRLARLSSVLAAVKPIRAQLEYIDLGLDNNIPLKLAKKGNDGKRSAEHNLQQATLPGVNPL